MRREYKWRAIVSSVIILLPMLAGLILWDRLPDSMATHWGADGAADGFGGKALTVFVLPGILLALHWLALYFTGRDPKNRRQNKTAMGLVFWLVPVISLFAGCTVYFAAFGRTLGLRTVLPALLGLLFVVVGNNLPKVTQNSTFGIKILWTLNNEENWNKTHRLGGKLWVIGGLVLLFSGFLPAPAVPAVVAAVIVLLVLVPYVYSYAFHRKQVRAGSVDGSGASAVPRGGRTCAAIFTPLILAAVAVLMFTGNVRVDLGARTFAVRASYWSDLEVAYDAVDSMEYREDCPAGIRTNGWGSARLSLGSFQNEAFGDYTRYCYTRCPACIVLRVADRTLVLSAEDAARTQALYTALSERIDGA